MTTRDKLNDPNLSEKEADEIIGNFVRRYENDRLRKEYTRKLKDQHQVTRSSGLKKVPLPNRRKALRWLPFLAIAASVLLAIFVWSPFQQSNSPESLLAEYLNPATQIAPTSRSGTNVTDEREKLRKIFFKNYREQDWSDAVHVGEQLSNRDNTENYFLAHAYLGTKDFASALTLFKRLTDDEVYQAEARWFLALLEYKIGNRQAGMEQLKSYRAGQPFFDKARKFLKAIGE